MENYRGVSMKEIKAVVQTSRLQKIHDAFHVLKEFPGMVSIRANWSSAHERKAGTVKEELTDFTRKALIFIVAPDEAVDEILRVLIDSTSTGQTSDGYIWVTDVGEAFRICDGRECRPVPQNT